MGWLDYHLHHFTISAPRTKKGLIFGIHDPVHDCADPPGWATWVAALFTLRNIVALYEYDFDDNWRHTVTLVAAVQRDFMENFFLIHLHKDYLYQCCFHWRTARAHPKS